MSFRNRTATVIAGTAVATALVGAAAFAAVDTTTTATMDGMPTHMAQLDGAAMSEMHSLMDGDASIGEMHQWMTEQGFEIGQMHRNMNRAGLNPGAMHRSMAGGR